MGGSCAFLTQLQPPWPSQPLTASLLVYFCCFRLAASLLAFALWLSEQRPGFCTCLGLGTEVVSSSPSPERKLGLGCASGARHPGGVLGAAEGLTFVRGDPILKRRLGGFSSWPSVLSPKKGGGECGAGRGVLSTQRLLHVCDWVFWKLEVDLQGTLSLGP
jgi:hypothetical protein